MLLLLATIISLIVLVGSGLALLYVLSKTNRYGTRVETGGFKFLVKGESLYKVLDNLSVTDGFVDQVTHKVIPVRGGGKKRGIGWLEKNLGISWISILWPIKRVHRFEVVADKLKTGWETGSEEIPIRQLLKTETRKTDYLRYRFPHPLLVTDVELGGDRWKVDFIIMLDVVIVNPATVVFDYKGRVLNQVDAAVSSAAIDYWNDPGFDYRAFVNTDKGLTSPFAKKILMLNKTTSPGRQLDGLEDRFGVKIMAAWVETANLSPEQKKLDDAAKAVDEQRHLADAKEHEARGKMALEQKPREGIALGLKAIVENLITSGLSPEQAAQITQEEVRMGNVAKSPLTTYVEGGGAVQPTVPVK